VLGPNGSGKTTLLSLVCGDHPQAYANDVRLFGRRRGTGESIWEVKRRIGLVSPELHLYFTEPLTAERTAATGFFDGVTDRPTTPDQDAAVGRLFAEFRLSDVAGRPFARLSTGQQRLVLLVRALVKVPELLILDEPFQGLDRPAIEYARGWLDGNLRTDQTLVFVSHHPDEVPRTVTRALRLDGGRVVV
jgi:molybdate transport system ATP-binding protein